MHIHEALALAGMAEGLDQYNRGVLMALGHEDLFDAWERARMGAAIAHERVLAADAAMHAGAPLPTWSEILSGYDEIDANLLAAQVAAEIRLEHAWAPIRALNRHALIDHLHVAVTRHEASAAAVRADPATDAQSAGRLAEMYDRHAAAALEMADAIEHARHIGFHTGDTFVVLHD